MAANENAAKAMAQHPEEGTYATGLSTTIPGVSTLPGVSSGSKNLTEPEAYALLSEHGIPVPRFGVAQNPGDAARIARQIGYPVVTKVVSPDILHKSDVGGVRVGVSSDAEAQEAYDGILSAVRAARPDARLGGVLVAEMAGRAIEGGSSDAAEVIIGVTRDPEFGHAVMFGLGGIFVEVLRDVTFRVVPVTRTDALEMLDEIKGRPLLEGARGRKRLDVETLADIIANVSRFVERNPAVISMDLNPFLLFPTGACVVDAKISVDVQTAEA